MLRTIKTDIICSKDTYNKLFELNKESGRLYNDIIDISKEYRENNEGKWIGISELGKLTKRKYNLCSISIQSIIRKYLSMRDCSKKARDKGLNNRYPYRKKNYYNTLWNDNRSFKIINNHCLTLRLARDSITNRNTTPLYIKTVKELPTNIKQVELVYDNRLMLCISYDNEVEIEEAKDNNIASVDLGEIHSMACVCNNGESLIISGRKLRSINRFRNKSLGSIQKKLSKCKKGSRNYKKYIKVRNYIKYKSKNQINDTLHKTSRSFVDWCKDNEVSNVVIGDVSGISSNTKGRVNRKVRQKLSNWSYDKLLSLIDYKKDQYSISLNIIDESYTTQQCPCCGTRKKTSTRNYVCSCGYSEHRDIHSAMNIMSKYLYNGDIRQLDFDMSNRTYLRII